MPGTGEGNTLGLHQGKASVRSTPCAPGVEVVDGVRRVDEGEEVEVALGEAEEVALGEGVEVVEEERVGTGGVRVGVRVGAALVRVGVELPPVPFGDVVEVSVTPPAPRHPVGVGDLRKDLEGVGPDTLGEGEVEGVAA